MAEFNESAGEHHSLASISEISEKEKGDVFHRAPSIG